MARKSADADTEAPIAPAKQPVLIGYKIRCDHRARYRRRMVDFVGGQVLRPPAYPFVDMRLSLREDPSVALQADPVFE